MSPREFFPPRCSYWTKVPYFFNGIGVLCESKLGDPNEQLTFEYSGGG